MHVILLILTSVLHTLKLCLSYLWKSLAVTAHFEHPSWRHYSQKKIDHPTSPQSEVTAPEDMPVATMASQQSYQDELVRAAMMEELGNQRMDTLPMDDNHDRLHRHGPPPRVRRQVVAAPSHQGRAAAGIWQTAIESGHFKDEDAATVEGLSDLGGGRAYAAANQAFVRGSTTNMMSQMDPRAMENPGQAFHSRGRELGPRQRLPSSRSMHADTSTLGIITHPNMPVRIISGHNRVQELALVSTNGTITRTERLPSRYHPGTNRPNGQRPTQPTGPVRTTVRIQPLSRVSGPQPATVGNMTAPPSRSSTVPHSGSFLDQKRQDAVFEARVKYLKGGGNPDRSIWAVVLLSPSAEPQYMGYFILFIEKNEAHILEHNVMLDICTGDSDRDSQVIFRLKESETRQSCHRLIFQNNDKATEFLKTLSRLQNGGVAGVISDTPVVVAAATVPQVEEKITASTPATAQPIQSRDDSDPVSTTPRDRGSDETQPAPLPSKSAQVQKPPVLDLLSGPEDDTLGQLSPAAANIDAATPAPFGAVANEQTMAYRESSLFDIGADDSSPPRVRSLASSNIDDLSGIDWYIDYNHDNVAKDQGEAGEVVEEEDQSKEDPQVLMEMERMHDSLEDLVFLFLKGFDGIGAAGGTTEEKAHTLVTIKQTVADNTRNLASQATYFGALTKEQKLRVIDNFLAMAVVGVTETEDTNQDEPSEPSGDETTVVPEAGPSPAQTDATAVESSPSKTPRIEYSTDELMNVRSMAMSPPAYLRELDFLPPPPRLDPTVNKEEHDDEPVKKEPIAKATPTRSSTPVRAGTGPVQNRAVSMTPLGCVQNLVARHASPRPAAPPTPIDSPKTITVKFKQLSLTDTPVKPRVAPPVKVEASPAAEPASPPWEPTIKMEKTPSPVKVEPTPTSVKVEATTMPIKLEQTSNPVNQSFVLITHGSPLTEHKVCTSDVASMSRIVQLQVQPTTNALVGRTPEEIQRELKDKILASQAAEASNFNFTEQAQPGSAPARQLNGHSNGQPESPGHFNPQAAAFQPPSANQQTGSTQETSALTSSGGLKTSRWARQATTTVEHEGRFTGLRYENFRR